MVPSSFELRIELTLVWIKHKLGPPVVIWGTSYSLHSLSHWHKFPIRSRNRYLIVSPLPSSTHSHAQSTLKTLWGKVCVMRGVRWGLF